MVSSFDLFIFPLSQHFLISSFPIFRLIILFTIDRFIVVYFPFKHTLTKMNKIYIVILVITSILLYGSSLVTSSLHPISGEKKVCTVKKKLIDFGRYLMLMDTGLSMILPFVLISTFNLLIVVKLHKANSYFEYHINQRGNFCTFQTEDLRLSKIKRKKLESTVSFNPNLTEQESVSLRGNSHSSSLNQNMLQSAKNSLQTSRFLFETKKPSNELILCSFQSKKKFNLNRTTYILVLISTSFLLLNLPMALCKLWYFFNPSSNQKSEQIEELVERISCYIYYLNFSINFFFYNFHSTKLRRVLYEFFYAIRFLKRRTLSSSSLKRKQSLPCERTKYPLVISFK